MSRPLVAVIGSGHAGRALARHAHDVGAAVAASGAGLICGGLGGVMAAACEGAATVPPDRRGPIVGVLPGEDARDANPHVEVALPTGLGVARNVLLVRAAAAVVAVGGEAGTLSEIAHAWQLGRPLAAYLPAGGWGARLAGSRLDGRRADAIAAIADPQQLRAWLGEILAGALPRR